MRVKVGDQWHDSEEEPVCVEFVGNDRQNIIDMAGNCTKYGAAPDGFFTSVGAFETWMTTEEGAPPWWTQDN